MVKINVFDRKQAERYIPNESTIAIRCMSSQRVIDDIWRIKKHRIQYNPLAGNYVGILECVFDDVDPTKDRDVKGVSLFNVDIAERIVDFVEDNISKFEEIMIHCDQGLSRSAAVAAALGDFYDFEYPQYIRGDMNVFVNYTLQEALARTF